MSLKQFHIIFILIFSFYSKGQSTLESLVVQCKKAVVSITTYDIDNSPIAFGTGFFINSNGTCVTNYHVVVGAYRVEIKTVSGKIYKVNNVISQNEKMDIFKFSISNPNNYSFPSLNLSQTKAKEGEEIFVIGNPKGLDYSVSNGIVSSVRNDADLGQLIQMTAPISEGNSGSPLINMKGEVVGIVSFTLTSGQNLNFAMSVSNFLMLDEVGELKFPPAKVVNSNSTESQFKRFEWKTSSSTVLDKEVLTFSEEKGSASNEYTLVYLATLGGIDLEVHYDFEFDQLSAISIFPIRRHPKAYPDSKKGLFYSTDFKSAYNEFATFELKLMELVGGNYSECLCGIAFFCKDKDFVTSKNVLSTESEIQESALAYFNDEKGNGFGYSTCQFLNRWINEGNNSLYTLGFTYDKEKFIVNNQVMQCDWYLRIVPIDE